MSARLSRNAGCYETPATPRVWQGGSGHNIQTSHPDVDNYGLVRFVALLYV
ncbi:MAG: hypothetical protein WBN71_05335 [Acidimicrobiia bacterium]